MRAERAIAGRFIVVFHRYIWQSALAGYLLSYLLVAGKLIPRDGILLLWLYAPFIAPIFFGQMTYSKNLGWLTSVPVSKWRVLILTTLSSFAVFAITTIYALGVLIVLRKFGPYAIFDSAPGTVSLHDHGFDGWASVWLSIYFLTTFVIVATIAIAFPKPPRGTASRVRPESSVIRRQYVAAGLIVAALVWLLEHFNSEILLFAVGIAGMLYVLYHSMTTVFGHQSREKRALRLGLAGVWILLNGIAIGIIRTEIESSDPAVAIRARSALPDGGFRISEDRLSSFAEGASDPARVRKILELWRRDYYPGASIPYERIKNLFGSPDTASVAADFAGWGDVPLERVETLAGPAFAAWNRPDSHRLADWVRRKLTDAEITKLLHSEDEGVRRLALKWAEFHADPNAAASVVDAFSGPMKKGDEMRSERERIRVLETLGAMTGKTFRYDDIFSGKGRAAIAEAKIPPAVDCSLGISAEHRVQKNSLLSEGELNYCLRKDALEAGGPTLDRIARAEWETLPR